MGRGGMGRGGDGRGEEGRDGRGKEGRVGEGRGGELKCYIHTDRHTDRASDEAGPKKNPGIMKQKGHAPPGNRTRVARMGILHDTTTPAAQFTLSG